MARYNGVYVAQEVSQTVTALGVLIELQVPANSIIEIIRAWCGPGEDATPIDEMQDIQIYGDATPGTAGTALTELALQGGDAASNVVALGGPTNAAFDATYIADAFHLQNGWLYLPVPEERIRIVGGSSLDNVGLAFVSFNPTTVDLSYGMVWGELV
jgi:hypothetical protein